MKRLSGSSNPTNIKEISKNKVFLSISESDGKRWFALEKLDLSDLGLPHDSKVICTARAGKTSRRFELGTISSFSRKPSLLEGIDESSVLRFRLLIRNDQNAVLLATAEGINPVDVDEQLGESLLPMTGVDLGQLVWKLELDASTGPTLLFNNKVFPNAAGANNFSPFVSLVIPEALKQVLKDLSGHVEDLSDESSWRYNWGQWIDNMGLPRPLGDDEDENAQWVDESLTVFCDQFIFSDHLKHDMKGHK